MKRQEFFNTAAVTWDKHFQTQELLYFLEHLMSELDLGPGERILDVGTGTGVLIPFLLKAVGQTGHVTAIDYAEKMVELFRAKYAGFPNVSIAVQQVEKLRFSSESFDAITCFGLFPHLENKRKALRQMNRVLKHDGRLIIAHALSSTEIRNHHHNASSAIAHDMLPDDATMRELLKRAGFDQISIIDKPGRYLCLSVKSSM